MRRLLMFLLSWLLPPRLEVLERHASEYGTLLLQQVEGPTALYWQASLRARQTGGAPRYAWNATGDTLAHAIANVIDQAKDSGAMKRIAGATFRPRLGGAEFDE